MQIYENYVVVDIETTGLNANFDEIIEIGAIKVVHHQIVDEFSMLVKPQGKISSFITNLTGITNEMVLESETIDIVFKKFIDFLDNQPILGHNVSFDLRFLKKQYFRIYGEEWKVSSFDTLKIARSKLKILKHHRLGDLRDYYDIHQKQAHRGLSDCLTTKLIYDRLREESGE